MATLRDVARAAGVSLTTASYVLNGKGAISEETRQRVREAMRQVGYRRPSRTSGVIVAIASQPWGKPIHSLYQAAAEYGYDLREFTWPRIACEAPDPPSIRNSSPRSGARSVQYWKGRVS